MVELPANIGGLVVHTSAKKNENVLHEEKKTHDKSATNGVYIESEDDSGVELSNNNELEPATDKSADETDNEKCTIPTIRAKDSVNNFQLKPQSNNTNKCAMVNSNVNIKSSSSTDREIEILCEDNDADKSATDSESDNKTVAVLGNIKEEEESSESQTDTSFGTLSSYYRGDFDRDTSTADSSLSESTFKRSRSYGDKPTRRRTSTTQTRSISVDPGAGRCVGISNLGFDATYEVDDVDDDGKWRLSLEQFTSKRYGSKRKSTPMSKEMKSFYKHQDELIDAYKKQRRFSCTGSFYKSQDELINQYEEIRLDVDDAMENAEYIKQLRKKASLYAKITFFVNLALLAIKIAAVAMSGSISLISSLVDSAVDLVSGIVIWITTRAVKRTDRYVYPQGRTKLEPMAIVILSVIMSVASVQIIKESFSKIVGLAHHTTDPPIMDPPTVAIASVTVVSKLILFLLCRRIDHPTVQALALDHRNDVLSNFVAIVFGYIGSQEMQSAVDAPGLVYLDPIGAVAISIYIIVNWCITGWDQIKLLIGHTAKSDFISKITWICMDHHKKIQMVDTVKAYHFGNNFLVEVDVVLPAEMTLREAHDIAEPLQQKIEALPNVERAFVHVDYECSHDPKSEHKVV